VFDYLLKLHTSEDSARLIGEIFAFAHQHLSLRPSAAIMYAAPQEQSDYLRMKLHRPLRACGMVKNLGDAGGGPFWVEYPDGSQSLQQYGALEYHLCQGTADHVQSGQSGSRSIAPRTSSGMRAAVILSSR